MFTCAKIRSGGTYLKDHLTANDYYNENESVVGKWIGEEAKLLDLENKAIKKNDTAFENLRKNKFPDGSGKLTPKKENDH